ncbi:MAG: peptide-methionine (S)-S-oxide reductase MsrA [Thermoanaerobaculia bacterium]|nr:peptide-methionine (S)-S-oxide reductase MsrA [Thermoanaerobaculia bacterium]
MRQPLLLISVLLVIAACSPGGSAPLPTSTSSTETHVAEPKMGQPAPAPAEGLAVATFAGGCFWCMEPPFDKLDGVVATTSGYTGGSETAPTYEQVSSGRTGHAEAVLITYDPAKVSYERLLEVFWHNIDPTVENRQFCDRGTQYRTGIFANDAGQLRIAQASLAQLETDKPFEGEIFTDVASAGPFWPAEDYHQDFYKKDPVRYKTYRFGCGRDARLEVLWGSAAGH